MYHIMAVILVLLTINRVDLETWIQKQLHLMIITDLGTVKMSFYIYFLL